MGFRDENEALRARIQTLESEKEELRREKSRLEDALTGRPSAAEPSVQHEESEALVKTPSMSDGILERVSKREAEERSTERREAQEAAAARTDALERVQKRPKRVRVFAGTGHGVVEIGPNMLRDQLRRQAPFGFFFALVNPGIFVVIGLAFLFVFQFDTGPFWALVGPVLIWISVLTLINLAYAKWKSPPCRLEFTGEHFAFYKRGKEPVLFGKLGELKVDSPDPDPAELHEVRLSDGRDRKIIEFLCSDDVLALTSAIRSFRRSKKSKKKKQRG